MTGTTPIWRMPLRKRGLVRMSTEYVWEYVRPQPYVCKVEGHIMDGWTPFLGISGEHPHGLFSRRCVVPGCNYYERKVGNK
jgi:hypothetical protein